MAAAHPPPAVPRQCPALFTFVLDSCHAGKWANSFWSRRRQISAAVQVPTTSNTPTRLLKLRFRLACGAHEQTSDKRAGYTEWLLQAERKQVSQAYTLTTHGVGQRASQQQETDRALDAAFDRAACRVVEAAPAEAATSEAASGQELELGWGTRGTWDMLPDVKDLTRTSISCSVAVDLELYYGPAPQNEYSVVDLSQAPYSQVYKRFSPFGSTEPAQLCWVKSNPSLDVIEFVADRGWIVH